ncbi:MAG: pyruvate synthase subunit beta [Candidatus Heimdallarchaeota archaeon]|nr:pyruvate synthase subunit beta [Candidatus Heimdallarchaeota archaeon]
MVSVKELVNLELNSSSIRPGNLACAGCQLNANFKHTLSAIKNNGIAVVPACCTSVIQGAGQGYGMEVPIFNTAFAAAPAVASGIKQSMTAQGKDITVLVWAGDGGTADIGMASLSGAAERNEDILYVMYNNSGYQNTGNQKSGATPRGTKTTTTTEGKTTRPKNVARMMVAQGVPYVATANSAFPQDLYEKVDRAINEFKGGFRYIEIYSPCPPGWNVDTRDTHAMGKLATETGYWPLWESVNGVITLSKRGARYERPENRKPFSDYMDLQGRYAQVDEKLLDLAFEDIEYEWQWVRRFMSPL